MPNPTSWLFYYTVDGASIFKISRLFYGLILDWTKFHKQFRLYAINAKAGSNEVSLTLERRIYGIKDDTKLIEIGRVLSVGDGIVRARGLTNI